MDYKEGQGSFAVRMPTGETSNTYRISVSALANGHTAHFEVILHVGNDVTLQMSYTLNDGSRREIFCQNKQSRTADTVYDDELTDGYICHMKCLLSAPMPMALRLPPSNALEPGNSNKTLKHLRASDTVPLFLNKGKTGQNNFTVEAKDDSGKSVYLQNQCSLQA